MALVPDDGRDMADVRVDGVAEEEELDDRQHDHHRESEAIATKLLELLPRDHERAKAEAHCAAPSARTMETNASSTVTRVSTAERTGMLRAASTRRAKSAGASDFTATRRT